MASRQKADHEKLTPVEARQGFLDRPVLMVLIVSTAMVCLLFGFLWFGFF